MGVFASTGMAMACPKPSLVSQPFAQFGDTNNYFPLSGGNFEGRKQAAWHYYDAEVTAGNEPFYVGSSSDSQSLTINAGGFATSPVFCVDSTMPSFRFLARQSGAGSDLQVSLGWLNDKFKLTNSQVAELADGSQSNWGPAVAMNLASVLGLPLGGSYPVQLFFRATGSSGSWQIDDIYVDPYRSA